MYARILLGLVISASLSLFAQTTNSPGALRALSLRECIDLALSRNLELRIQQLSSDIAGFSLNGAYGAYVPTFSVRAVHSYVDQPGDFDPQKFNSDFPYQMKSDILSSDLKGALPYGLSYNLSSIIRKDDARTDFSSVPDGRFFPPDGIRVTNNYSASAGINLQQHLLRDFWIDSDRHLILVRRKELKMSQQALRFQIMKTVLAVELSYYDLIAAKEEIQVQERALQYRQQLVRETDRRVKVGDLPPLDAEQSETQLQNTITALSIAREVFVSRQNALKRLITDNFQEWADVDLQPADSLLAVPPIVDRSVCFQNALRLRPDLTEARVAIERSDVTVRYRYNQLFPNLDLIGRYGGLGSEAQLGSTVNDAFSARYPDYFYGVVISLPVSNVSERNSYRSSQASKRISEIQLQKAEQEVLWQVADLANRIQSRFSQVNSSRKATTYAEAALAAEQKKLDNGLSTSFFVLQLQETLTSARNTEVLAIADYNKALAQLAFADGTTLERHHLNLEVK
jgi:outer membrane protein TolC